MGGIVMKPQANAASGGDVDTAQSEVVLNGLTSSFHQSQSQLRGSEPFQCDEARQVWSANDPSDHTQASCDNGRHHRPPLHPSRNAPPENNNNLSVDTSNNINSSNSTPRSAIVANSSVNSTPVKDQSSLLSCVNQTPVGDEKSKYQYYCPLCMRHFQETLVVSCCNNYICFQCTVEFLGSKSIEVTRLEDMMSQQSKEILKNIMCPHCCQEGFIPNRVKHTDEVRNYTITPRACNCGKSYNGMSPLKPGDSFEIMSQKMLKFDTNVKRKNDHMGKHAIDARSVMNDDDYGSEDSTSRRLSPSSLKHMESVASSLLGPEVDEENDATQIFQAPAAANTSMRRKIAVESYIEEILCEVCQSRAAIVC